MASFKAKLPVLWELFEENHRGVFGPPGVRHKARCAFVPMPGLYGTIICYVVK